MAKSSAILFSICVYMLCGQAAMSMWTSFEQRKVPTPQEKKNCLPTCQLFPGMCKNNGKCKEKLGLDCAWYCECPANCEGFFCEKVITNGTKTGIKLTVVVEKEKKVNTGGFDKSKLGLALLNISNLKKTEDGKSAEDQKLTERIGDTIIQKETVTQIIQINCPPELSKEIPQKNKTNTQSTLISNNTDMSGNETVTTNSTTAAEESSTTIDTLSSTSTIDFSTIPTQSTTESVPIVSSSRNVASSTGESITTDSTLQESTSAIVSKTTKLESLSTTSIKLAEANASVKKSKSKFTKIIKEKILPLSKSTTEDSISGYPGISTASTSYQTTTVENMKKNVNKGAAVTKQPTTKQADTKTTVIETTSISEEHTTPIVSSTEPSTISTEATTEKVTSAESATITGSVSTSIIDHTTVTTSQTTAKTSVITKDQTTVTENARTTARDQTTDQTARNTEAMEPKTDVQSRAPVLETNQPDSTPEARVSTTSSLTTPVLTSKEAKKIKQNGKNNNKRKTNDILTTTVLTESKGTASTSTPAISTTEEVPKRTTQIYTTSEGLPITTNGRGTSTQILREKITNQDIKNEVTTVTEVSSQSISTESPSTTEKYIPTTATEEYLTTTTTTTTTQKPNVPKKKVSKKISNTKLSEKLLSDTIIAKGGTFSDVSLQSNKLINSVINTKLDSPDLNSVYDILSIKKQELAGSRNNLLVDTVLSTS